ncbi:MAG: hypothetical protein LIO96_09000 [Lachnospiraceae bacterium]|nr:hypothetical protein [Lachnospiraceae bacterium]
METHAEDILYTVTEDGEGGGHLFGAVVETHHVSGSYSYYSNKTGKTIIPLGGSENTYSYHAYSDEFDHSEHRYTHLIAK